MGVQDGCVGLVYGWAEARLLQSCRGQRAAEGRIVPQELSIEVGFSPLNLRENVGFSTYWGDTDVLLTSHLMD